MASAVRQSRRFRILERRIRRLDERFLPELTATASYTDAEYDSVRAYRLLVHAELESCLEDLVEGLVLREMRRWSTVRRRVSKCLVALVGYHHATFEARPEKADPTTLLIDRVRDSVGAFLGYVRSRNHGIREPNLLNLLLPVGVDRASLDDAWVANLDSFGHDRGETAHVASFRTVQLPDPKTEQDKVTELMKAVSEIDIRLLELRS